MSEYLSRASSEERGFSLIELMVVVSMVAIIAVTALPAYRLYTKRAYNAVAESDLRNLVSLGIPASEEALTFNNYLFFNQEGPTTLPEPLSEVSLSDGVVAPFIYKWRFSFGVFDFDYTLVSVYHERGSYQYYWYDINGTRFRFRIERA